MNAAIYLTGFVILGTFLVTWALGRMFGGIREPLGVAGNVVGRVGLGVLLALVAADAATHGGFWWLLVPVVGVLALWNFALSAGIVWAWTSEEPGAGAG
jgi:hypothetical protein